MQAALPKGDAFSISSLDGWMDGRMDGWIDRRYVDRFLFFLFYSYMQNHSEKKEAAASVRSGAYIRVRSSTQRFQVCFFGLVDAWMDGLFAE